MKHRSVKFKCDLYNYLRFQVTSNVYHICVKWLFFVRMSILHMYGHSPFTVINHAILQAVYIYETWVEISSLLESDQIIYVCSVYSEFQILETPAKTTSGRCLRGPLK